MAQVFRGLGWATGRPAVSFSTGGRGLRQPCRTIAAPLTDPRFLTFVRSHFENAREERLHVTYLDSAGHYLADETLATGLTHCAATRARTLFAKAMAADAKGFILAHNHPSGICRPSEDDIRSTDRVRHLAAALDIPLIDHLIVTTAHIYSMQSGRLL